MPLHNQLAYPKTLCHIRTIIIEHEFTHDTIPVRLLGMDAGLMRPTNYVWTPSWLPSSNNLTFMV